mmetsp:Transcript_34126/g.81517  ORF Transcript_34126/g.81517 Transcript_34126/m.81517 type:complete len:289 (+) Transcript_34126:1073-1939(+)
MMLHIPRDPAILPRRPPSQLVAPDALRPTLHGILPVVHHDAHQLAAKPDQVTPPDVDASPPAMHHARYLTARPGCALPLRHQHLPEAPGRPLSSACALLPARHPAAHWTGALRSVLGGPLLGPRASQPTAHHARFPAARTLSAQCAKLDALQPGGLTSLPEAVTRQHTLPIGFAPQAPVAALRLGSMTDHFLWVLAANMMPGIQAGEHAQVGPADLVRGLDLCWSLQRTQEGLQAQTAMSGTSTQRRAKACWKTSSQHVLPSKPSRSPGASMANANSLRQASTRALQH